jgi:hypothetical protein
LLTCPKKKKKKLSSQLGTTESDIIIKLIFKLMTLI